VSERQVNLQTVKLGVQYSLWGGSVMNLGTERHKQEHFEAIDRYKLPGKSTYA
jgi:acyl-CoA oxidase